MCPIERHQWPWVTMKVSLAVRNLSNSHLLGNGTYICVSLCDRKRTVVSYWKPPWSVTRKIQVISKMNYNVDYKFTMTKIHCMSYNFYCCTQPEDHTHDAPNAQKVVTSRMAQDRQIVAMEDILGCGLSKGAILDDVERPWKSPQVL